MVSFTAFSFLISPIPGPMMTIFSNFLQHKIHKWSFGKKKSTIVLWWLEISLTCFVSCAMPWNSMCLRIQKLDICGFCSNQNGCYKLSNTQIWFSTKRSIRGENVFPKNERLGLHLSCSFSNQTAYKYLLYHHPVSKQMPILKLKKPGGVSEQGPENDRKVSFCMIISMSWFFSLIIDVGRMNINLFYGSSGIRPWVQRRNTHSGLAIFIWLSYRWQLHVLTFSSCKMFHCTFCMPQNFQSPDLQIMSLCLSIFNPCVCVWHVWCLWCCKDEVRFWGAKS